MLTIQTVENIKRGSKITLFNGIYTIILAIVYLSTLRIIAKMNFKVINVVWQVFDKYNPTITFLFIKLMILKSIFMLIFGIIIIAFSIYLMRRKDKTAWVILFFTGLLFWASLLTLDIMDKNPYTITASFIGWLMFIIGMLIPIRYYLEREYTDY